MLYSVTAEIPEKLRNAITLSDLINLGLLHQQSYNRSVKYNIIVSRLYKLIPPLCKLNEMVGMDKLKKQIVKNIKYFSLGLHIYDDKGQMLHTVLSGPPGHGKTEVAKIIADIYLRLGFLKTNKFIAPAANQLIGKVLGETGPKTEAVFTKALGGVIFIDEAYSLSSGVDKNGENSDAYAKECIDTICRLLDKHRKDLVCIIAGYKDALDTRFFALNSGLQRRFPYNYNIDPYNGNQLFQILQGQICKSNWKLNGIDIDDMKNTLIKNKRHFINGGGDTENLMGKIRQAHATRLFGHSELFIEENRLMITYDDFSNGMTDFIERKNGNVDNIKKDIHYSMYN